jgi:ABC-type phosphate/phosphonate transport system permease subunit
VILAKTQLQHQIAMTEQHEARTVVLKIGGTWGVTGIAKWFAAAGITSWSDVSAIAATIVSIVIVVDYVWKWCRRRRPRSECEPTQPGDDQQ